MHLNLQKWNSKWGYFNHQRFSNLKYYQNHSVIKYCQIAFLQKSQKFRQIVNNQLLTFYTLFQFVILVVDSTDRDRLSITKDELHKMMGHEELSKANILVFANKQDVKGCLSAAEISKLLNLQSIRNHGWHIQACCALTGEG